MVAHRIRDDGFNRRTNSPSLPAIAAIQSILLFHRVSFGCIWFVLCDFHPFAIIFRWNRSKSSYFIFDILHVDTSTSISANDSADKWMNDLFMKDNLRKYFNISEVNTENSNLYAPNKVKVDISYMLIDLNIDIHFRSWFPLRIGFLLLRMFCFPM